MKFELKSNSAPKYLTLLFMGILFFSVDLFSQVSASFTSDKVEGCINLEVKFTSTSTGSNLAYLWTFEPDNSQSTLQNPSKTYLTPGTHGVKLRVTNTLTGQSNEVNIQNYITAFPKPVANFTVPGGAEGCSPFPVTFNDAASSSNGAIVSRKWTFGNSQIATDIVNPTTTYNAAGNYNIFYEVTDAKGCKNEVLRTAFIKVNPALVDSFSANPRSACNAPLNITLTPFETNPTYAYKWTVSGGVGVSNTRVPTLNFPSNGSYDVTLDITGPNNCSASKTVSNFIVINKPTAAYNLPSNFTTNTICTGTPINFTNASLGGTSFKWDFAPSAGSTLKDPTFTFIAPGTYNVKLVATSGIAPNTCSDSITKTIIVEQVDIAIDGGPFTDCKIPSTFNFTSTSTNIDAYSWDYGNSQPGSTNPTATAVYNSYGVYDVKLTGTTTYGCRKEVTKNAFVKIEKPDIVFGADLLKMCVGSEVKFSDVVIVNDNITTRNWNFGDGTIQNGNNGNTMLSHTFNKDGDFNVKFTFITAKGCTATDSILISVGKKPLANFKVTPIEACAFDTTYFTDLSTVDGKGGLIDEWMWISPKEITGDSNATAVHKNDLGTFDVEFRVGYNGCYDTIVKPQVYTKLGPIARVVEAKIICGENKVRFKSYIRGETGFQWDFNNDGIVDNTTDRDSAEFVFNTPGTYKCVIKAFNDANGCEYTDTISFLVPAVSSDFVLPNVLCSKGSLAFTPTNPLDATAFAWSINGDTIAQTKDVSYAFNNPGVFKVRLTVKTANCNSFTEKSIKVYGVYPKLDQPNASGCKPVTVNFSAAPSTADTTIFSYQWFQGTVAISGAATTGNLSYPTSGTYNLKLIIKDVLGCVKDTTYTGLVTVYSPASNFSVEKNLYCTGNQVKLIDNSTSNSSIASYLWTVSTTPPQTFTDKNPVFTINNFGNFNVKLKVTDAFNCTEEKTIPNLIKVEPTPTITKVFTDKTVYDCFPATQVQFKAEVLPRNFTGYAYTWNLGAGSASATIPDTFAIDTYTQPGLYTITLRAETPGGCFKDTVLLNYLLVKGPSADYEIDKIKVCVDEPIRFVIKNKVDVQNYRWDFGDGFIDSVATLNSDTLFHSYTLPGIKSAILRSFSGTCENQEVVSIEVVNVLASFNLPDFPLITERDTLVQCSPFNFKPNNSSIGDAQFRWFLDGFPDETVDKNPQRTYTVTTVPDTLNIYLSVTDPALGCTDTAFQRIIVSPIPITNAGVDSTLCTGETIALQGTGTGATKFEWSPNLFLNDSSLAGPTANPLNDVTYTLKTTNVFNCSSSDQLTIRRDKTTIDFTVPQINGCDSLQTSLVNNSFANVHSWLFTPDNATSNVKNPSYVFRTKGINTINLSVYDISARCAKTLSKTIEVFALPTLSILQDTILCKGESIRLMASSSAGAPQWSPVDFLDNPNSINPLSTPIQDVSYTLKITDANNCENQKQVNIGVDNSSVDFSLSNDTACANLNLQITNNSVGTSFEWDFGNGTSSTAQFPGNIIYNTAGNYNINLVVFDKTKRCNDTLSKFISVLPIPVPQVNADTFLCIGQTYQLQASGGTVYAWFPNDQLNDDSIPNPLASPTSDITYKVIVSDDFGCKDSAEVSITFKPDYSINVPTDTTINIGNTVFFDASTDSDVSHKWELCNPSKNTDFCTTCPSNTFMPLDTTCYLLTTIDAKGCYKKVSQFTVNVKEEYAIDVPTAFTPNGDSRNDKIFVKGIGVKKLVNFTIYNRWGEVVFKTEDLNIGWDGIYKDKIQNDETYVYTVNAEMYNGKIFTRNGYITLLK